MEFEVTILGSSSATPTATRNPSAQILHFRNKFFLIDCGEGTQVRIRQNRIKYQKIDKIFISHLHGDHYLGLFGLLCSLNLNNRKQPVEIYCPEPLEELIRLQAKISMVYWAFPLKFIHTNPKEPELLYEDSALEIHSFPLKHRIATTGFVFKEKPMPRKLNPKMLRDYDIPVYARNQIKYGSDYTTDDGIYLSNESLTFDPPKPRSYAYCSDTAYLESVIPHIKEADLLYHETTFLKDMAQRAKFTKHSTTEQAGTIAKLANVKKLIIGHFSARYHELHPFLEETKEVFENCELAIENKTFQV